MALLGRIMIKEIEYIIDDLSDSNRRFSAKLSDINNYLKKIKNENAKLKEALEFYANKDNWEFESINPDNYDGATGGELARKTLKELYND